MGGPQDSLRKELKPVNKDLTSEMRKEAQESSPSVQHNSGNLNEAIKAVYRRYGTDLPAFFQDAYKEAACKHQEAVDDNGEVYPV